MAGRPVVPFFHRHCTVGRCGHMVERQFSCVWLTQFGHHICLIRPSGEWHVQADWQFANLVSSTRKCGSGYTGWHCSLGCSWDDMLSAFLHIILDIHRVSIGLSNTGAVSPAGDSICFDVVTVPCGIAL